MPLTFDEVVKDQDFIGLADVEQVKVISSIDEDFNALPMEEKNKVIQSMRALTTEQRATAEERIETTKRLNIEAGKQKFMKEAPETAGGVVGGIVGGVIGKSPAAARAGAVAGAGIGGAAGKFISQLISGEDVEPMEIAKAGGRQVLYEAGGQLTVGAAGKILAPFMKKITPEAKIAEETLGRFMPKETSKLKSFLGLKEKQPLALLPAEATENRTLDLLENVAESSLVGGGRIAEFKKVIRPQAINDMVDDVISKFSASADPDMIGNAFVGAIQKEWEPSKLAASSLYNTVESLTEHATMKVTDAFGISSTVPLKINISRLKSFAKPLLARAKTIGNIEAKNAGDDLIKAVDALPDFIDYATAKDLRSRLLSRVSEMSVANKGAPAIGKANKLAAMVDNSIEKSLKENSPNAYRLWRKANEIWKIGSAQYNNQFLKKLAKEAIDRGNPEVIAEKIFKPRAVSNIRKTKAALDDDTWKQLKGWNVQNLIKKSTNQEGELLGINLRNQMFGKSGLGEQAMKEIYTPNELISLKNLSTALEVTQRKQGEGVGRMFIQLTQAGAVVGLLDERSRPISMVWLGGPAILSRILTHPSGARWLTQGLKLPVKSPQIGAILIKVGALASDIRSEMIEKGETRERPPELIEETPEGAQSALGGR